MSTAGTGHFYTTDKNKKTTPAKMEIKKYDPVVRQHRGLQGSEDREASARAPCARLLPMLHPGESRSRRFEKPATWRAFSLDTPRAQEGSAFASPAQRGKLPEGLKGALLPTSVLFPTVLVAIAGGTRIISYDTRFARTMRLFDRLGFASVRSG